MAITTATTIPTTDNSLLSGSVSAILGLKASAATDTAAAKAATTQATGYTAEGDAYQTAADIAAQNAIVAGIAGDTKQLQEQRALTVTGGEQRAQVAAAGFGASGSNLDIMRSTLQQGYLTQQLTSTQTALTAGGYLEEAAASKMEKAATGVTAAAATDASTSYTAASALSTANAATETAALNDFVGTSTLTSAQQLILDPLTNTTGKVANTTTIPLDVTGGTWAGRANGLAPPLAS